MSNPFSSIITDGLNPSQGGTSDARATTSAAGDTSSANTPTSATPTTDLPTSTTPTTSPSTTSSQTTTTSPPTISFTSTTSSSTSTALSAPSTTSISTTPLTPTTTDTTTSQSTFTPQTSLQVTTESNGGIATITVVNSVAPSQSSAASSSSAAANDGSSESFFENKGAVAGTFTVVSLIGAALLIFILTWAARRRKARRADRESEEAAASVPAFLDDHEDRPRYGGGGYSMPVPSASSHGTFAQPPMSTEHYQMSDMVGAAYAGESAYPAFITPQGQQQQFGYSDYPGPVSPPLGSRPLSGAYSLGEHEMYEGAGLGAVAGAGNAMAEYNNSPAPISRANTTYISQTTPSESQTDLSRTKSQCSRSLLDTTPSSPTTTTHSFISPTNGESYAAHYRPGFTGVTPRSPAGNRRRSSAYDLSNPFTRSAEDSDIEGDGSGAEEEPRKVLKVANE